MLLQLGTIAIRQQLLNNNKFTHKKKKDTKR